MTAKLESLERELAEKTKENKILRRTVTKVNLNREQVVEISTT